MNNNQITMALIAACVLIFVWINWGKWFSRKTLSSFRRKTASSSRSQPDPDQTQLNPTPGSGKSWKLDETNQKIIISGIILLLLLNLLFKFMTRKMPAMWNWYTEDMFFFLGFNIGWIAFIFYFSQKDNDGKPIPEMQRKSIMIAGAIVVFTIINLAGSFRNRETPTPTARASDPMVASRYDGIPAEVALPQICGCESSGVAGRIWHYKNNDPNQGINTSETNDVGACQINVPLHEKVADEKYGLKIRTPEGNMEYAKVLYRDHGVQPWVGKPGKTTIHCWGPKLAALRQAGEYEVKLVAPAKEFGPARDVAGYEFSWGRSPGAFVVRNDQGLEAKFDPDKNIREDLPYLNKGEKRGYSKTIQFKSLDDKPQQVVLELKRQ